MPLITQNEYGIISVDGSTLSKMIIHNLLSFDDALIPCTRKGKMIHKGFLTGFNEYNNAIEIHEINEQIHIRIYVIAKIHGRMTGISNQLFDLIEDDFRALCMNPPTSIELCIWGFLPVDAKQPIENNRSIRRENNEHVEIDG